MGIVWTIIIGLVAGIVAKFVQVADKPRFYQFGLLGHSVGGLFALEAAAGSRPLFKTERLGFYVT